MKRIFEAARKAAERLLDELGAMLGGKPAPKRRLVPVTVPGTRRPGAPPARRRAGGH